MERVGDNAFGGSPRACGSESTLRPPTPPPNLSFDFVCLVLFFFCRLLARQSSPVQTGNPTVLLLLSALKSHNLTQCLTISWDRTTSLRPLTHGV